MTVQEIGAIRREFKPALENTIAGFIIGLLMIGGGCAAECVVVKAVIESRGNLPVWVEKGWSWGALGILGVLGIVFIVTGVWLARWMRSLFSLRVRVGINGLSVTKKNETQVIAWPDIVSIEETHHHEPMVTRGALKHALPKVMSESFMLKIKDRDPFVFDVNTIRGHVMLAQMIKKETDKRNIPWEIVERQAR